MRPCRFWLNVHIQCIKPAIGLMGPGEGIRMCQEHIDYTKSLGVKEQDNGADKQG